MPRSWRKTLPQQVTVVAPHAGVRVAVPAVEDGRNAVPRDRSAQRCLEVAIAVPVEDAAERARLAEAHTEVVRHAVKRYLHAVGQILVKQRSRPRIVRRGILAAVGPARAETRDGALQHIVIDRLVRGLRGSGHQRQAYPWSPCRQAHGRGEWTATMEARSINTPGQ